MENPKTEDLFTAQEFWKDFDSIKNSSGALSDGLFSREKVFLYDTIGSTNTELLKQLNEQVYSKGNSLLCESDGVSTLTKEGLCFHKRLLAAAEQTAGRGRMGRKFYSPTKSGIYFSFAYVPNAGVKDPYLYTITSVVGVCRAIRKVFGIQCSIKWVNDIYLGQKKICGILTEGITNPKSGKLECAVVGIGINILADENLPDELKDKAGGILDGKKESQASRTKLLAACIYEILKSLDSHENIMEEYKSHSMLTGRTVRVSPTIGDKSSEYTATVLGISDSAALIVQKEDGSQAQLSTGEVSLKMN
ncbi:MAG: biotin--[acetyl-CoA-carboxylase] ligase [Treponema sp.]|nr:biotin--[acetyl-CoA-carboxylase] ligase [Treponema sp.]